MNINVISTERCAVAVHREVIISDLLSGSIISIFRENDLQADVPPAGIHQGLTENCNRGLCHRLGSLLLMLMIFALKWPPIIVFLLSCLPDVILPAKWQAGRPCIRAFTGSDSETLERRGKKRWRETGNENHIIICAEWTKKKVMEPLKMKENYDAARAKSAFLCFVWSY